MTWWHYFCSIRSSSRSMMSSSWRVIYSPSITSLKCINNTIIATTNATININLSIAQLLSSRLKISYHNDGSQIINPNIAKNKALRSFFNLFSYQCNSCSGTLRRFSLRRNRRLFTTIQADAIQPTDNKQMRRILCAWCCHEIVKAKEKSKTTTARHSPFFACDRDSSLILSNHLSLLKLYDSSSVITSRIYWLLFSLFMTNRAPKSLKA